MRSVTTWMVILATMLSTPAAGAAQREVTRQDETAALSQMASAIPPGSKVRLQTTSGRRMTVVLITATADGILVKKNTRLPEPAVALRFDEIARLERVEGGGISIGRALGIGLAAGAGAIMTLFAMAFALDD